MEKRGHVHFVRLPVQAQRPINGGCQCAHCKARPGATPMWDTLAIDTKATRNQTWIVHFPELKDGPINEKESAS